jgi:hypothetical protein
MKYFDFDESDLSAKQHARLVKRDRSARNKFRIVGLIFASVAVVPTISVGEKLASQMKKEQGVGFAVYYYGRSDTVATDLMDSYIMSIEAL